MPESAQPSAGYSYNEQDGPHACWFAEGIDLALADLYCVTIMSGTEAGIYLYGQINESPFLKYIYDNNMIMALITGLKYAFIGV